MEAERIVFAGQDDCRVERFDVGEPGVGEVRVRNRASLVSAGTELAVLRRRHRAFSSGGEAAARFRYPFHPGYAIVGVVESAGDGTGLAVGDTVWHDSPHATWSVVAAERCRLVPEGVDPRDATFFGLAQIAMTAVRRAPVLLGESVLVSGLGLVGMLVGRLYQLAGAEVSGADFSPGRRARAADFGFDPVLDLSEAPLVEWFDAHPDRRPDVAIEAAGIESNIEACMKAARPGGRVVLQGSPRNTMTIDPYTDIHRKGLTIIGAHDSTVPDEVRRRDVPLLFELCRDRLRIGELRTHEAPMADAPRLYDELESNLDQYLALVLTY